MKAFVRDVGQAARATAVLVATLVGAGYATGREISQYFGAAGGATIVCTAVLIAAFSMAFLYVGAAGGTWHGRLYTAYRVTLSVLAVISCGVMVAAGKALLSGRWTAVLLLAAGVSMCLQDRVFHLSNVCTVPILIVLVVVVAVAAPDLAMGSAFLPLSAANYAGMNLLLEGELLRKEGMGMRPRAILFAGAGITVCMSLLLLAMHRIVGASASTLPFAEVCAALGKGYAATGVILLSILSSIAGGMRITLDVWSRRMSMALSGLLALLTALMVALIPFADLVRVVYPIMGWMGVAVVVVYVAEAARLWFAPDRHRIPPIRRPMWAICKKICKKGARMDENAY